MILTEFHHKNPTPYFIDYVKQYTDSPMLVKLDKTGGQYRPGRLLRANELAEHKDISNGDWKFVNVDANSGRFVIPKGAMGHRWDKKRPVTGI